MHALGGRDPVLEKYFQIQCLMKRYLTHN
jgi:hypothetical protein